MKKELERIKELVHILNEASREYYQKDNEIMSNIEYDALYDELLTLEKKTGFILSNSPSVHVGYEIISELQKVSHEYPMLSLDKTKDVEALADWLGEQKGLLSWKLDGLTIVLTYNNGVLEKAVTRGNGEIGEDVTNNAKVFVNLPSEISYQKKLTIRGEAVIKYSDFKHINELIEDADAKYKNPRNLCSGSVRQLNNEITAKRNVHFFAFSLVPTDPIDFENSNQKKFEFLEALGFDVVPYAMVTKENVAKEVEAFAEKITHLDIPSDGLVLLYDNISYGAGLGNTSKFPRDSIAFKWADELAETNVIEIEWSPSRTGLINPVAIFKPVELEGSTVSRASLHNISILEELKIGIGDEIAVYKANMIIPQVAENKTQNGPVKVPEHCPACGGITEIHDANGIRSLYCINPLCSAKKSKAFAHFVGRNALNIEGLSEATLNKFIDKGFLNELYDIFNLKNYQDEIIEMEGLGEKSFKNLIKSIDHARHTTMDRFLYSLGIPNIGTSNAKMICKAYEYDFSKISAATLEELVAIDGIGNVIAQSVIDFFQNEHNKTVIAALLKEIEFEKTESLSNNLMFEGKTFVITGSLEKFANRNEAKQLIEEHGGKVTGSVTNKTDYLINNDNLSNSSKNKKAKELEIPIINEDEFLKLLQKEG